MAGLEGVQLGSYEILQRIGSGGMAEVYRAKQLTAFGREVAIKVVRAGYSADPNFRERFLREAQAISRLSHPNILPLIEFGEQDEMLFLVMPLVREGTLRDLLQQRKGSLPLEEAISFFTQLCNAVHYAHTQGIIHRDIKPQNMLLQQGTHLLLADFGIARDTADSRMTTMGVGIGTVEYMAPEQALGQADARGDIYSLGIVLYQLLTGQVPYSGSTPFQTLQKHSSEPLPDPRTFNPTLPDEAISVLKTALEKDPKDRFQSAQALGRAAQQLRSAAPRPIPPPLAVPPPVANTPVPPFSPSNPLFGGRQDQSSPSDPAVSGQSGLHTPGGPLFPSPYFPPPLTSPQSGTGPTYQQEFFSLPTIISSLPQNTDPGAGNSAPQWSSGKDTPMMASGPQPPLPGSPGWGSGPQPPLPGSPGWGSGQPIGGSGPHAPIPGGIALAPTGQRQAPTSPPAPRRGSPLSALTTGVKRFSLPQRLLFGGLAVLIILGSVVAILLSVHPSRTSSTSTNQITVATESITRYGSVNATTVAGASGPPQAQSNVAARLRTATPPVIPNHITNLPTVPATQQAALVSPSAYPAALAVPQPLAGFSGLGQAELGIDAPIDISVASNGTASIEVVDGDFIVATSSTVKVISLAVFFQQLIGPEAVLGESRVFFDASLEKWIFISNQLEMKNGGITGSALDLALSADASPLDNWDIYQFTTAAQAYGGCNWADFPQLGTNAVGVFITATSFACGIAGRLYGASLWELSKQSLGSGTINNVFVTTGFTTAQGNPVVTLTPAVEGGKDSVEWVLSNDAGYVDDGQVSQRLAVWAVVGNPSGARPTPPTIIMTDATLPHPYADPPLALQLGSPKPLTTGDARIVQAQLVNSKHLFAAFTTAINWVGDPVTRAGIYWVDLLPTLQNAADPRQSKVGVSVFQQGVVGDPSAYFYSPSFVADAFGNVVLLAVVSASDLDPHLGFTSRLASDPFGTFGGTNHQYLFMPLANTGPYTGSHWGDYGGAYAAPVLPDGKSQWLWVAGPYVDRSSGWKTNIWQIPTKSA
jgi:serine/threonine protein kinase